MPSTLTPQEHRRQIEAYTLEFPHYEIFANALRRVLSTACSASIPEVIIQARAKSVQSFAEKCVRKYAKYPDAVNQLTDLCGGRIIVQTLEQVNAVSGFLEQHFQILERDDKTTALRTDQFGYRDMHFIIQVPDNCTLGFTDKERSDIGKRRAELQVRTWVQHAWADTLHDRIYKTPLRFSSEIKRRGNLLAAVMEDGDRGFNHLALELDGMIANYAANAGKEDVEKEIEVQRLLLESADAKSRPGIALKLARLITIQGKWSEIVQLLDPYKETKDLPGLELRSELGIALCRLQRANPSSSEYRRGQGLLQQVIADSERTETSAVPNLRRARSVHARALARLGWSYESIDADANEARNCWARAAELEPGNPYYLTEMLGFELRFARETGLLASFRSTIRSALLSCKEHQEAGTELPTAHFTAGRLQLLLQEPMQALLAYARGLRHCITDLEPAPCDALANEIAWLNRIDAGQCMPEAHQWARDLLELGAAIAGCRASSEHAAAPTGAFPSPVLIVAGGVATLPKEDLPRIRDLLQDALVDFTGTILSGGTTAGVPGCLGAAAETLRTSKLKRFHLRGYIPKLLPHDVEKDKRYDQILVSGAEHFSPVQILHGWKDILATGISAKEVLLLGWGGGPIAAFEYRLALALGATVGVVSGSGGAVDALLRDPLWATLPNLFPLPADPKTLRAFVNPDGSSYESTVLDAMAQEFHARYRNDNLHKIKPDAVKLWKDLPSTFKAANREQAAYAIRILEAAGFGVRKAAGTPVIFTGFAPEEIDKMAELEHGRWNIERLRDGWRPGPRADDKKLHDCLVAWADSKVLTEEIKDHDRKAVRAFPEVLAVAGLEVYRP